MKKIKTNKQLEFNIFCIEMYANEKNMSGVEVNALFNKYNVNNFLKDCYDALHTQGFNYICSEIDNFLESRKNDT